MPHPESNLYKDTSTALVTPSYVEHQAAGERAFVKQLIDDLQRKNQRTTFIFPLFLLVVFVLGLGISYLFFENRDLKHSSEALEAELDQTASQLEQSGLNPQTTAKIRSSALSALEDLSTGDSNWLSERLKANGIGLLNPLTELSTDKLVLLSSQLIREANAVIIGQEKTVTRMTNALEQASKLPELANAEARRRENELTQRLRDTQAKLIKAEETAQQLASAEKENSASFLPRINNLNAEVEKLKKENSGLSAEIRNRTRAFDALAARYRVKEKEIRALQAKSDTLANKLSLSNKQLTVLQAKNARLTEDFAITEKLYTELQARHNNLRGAINASVEPIRRNTNQPLATEKSRSTSRLTPASALKLTEPQERGPLINLDSIHGNSEKLTQSPPVIKLETGKSQPSKNDGISYPEVKLD